MTDEQAHRLAEQLRAYPDSIQLAAKPVRTFASALTWSGSLKYDDLPLDTVDASVIALAERLNITTVVTVNRRDFGIVRPARVPAPTPAAVTLIRPQSAAYL